MPQVMGVVLVPRSSRELVIVITFAFIAEKCLCLNWLPMDVANYFPH